TNLRRRPGAEYKFSLLSTSTTKNNTAAWYTDIAGRKVHIILNCTTGHVRVLDEAFVVQATLGPSTYLQASDIHAIRATTVGDEFFFCNVDKVPAATPGPTNSYL